jgi:hypothetical protein
LLDTCQCVFIYLYFWGQFCVANNPQEDSAKFGYKLNMKVIFLDILLYFWLPVLKPCIQNLRIFLQFCSNYGYWKSQKALNFSTFSFEYGVFGYI